MTRLTASGEKRNDAGEAYHGQASHCSVGEDHCSPIIGVKGPADSFVVIPREVDRQTGSNPKMALFPDRRRSARNAENSVAEKEDSLVCLCQFVGCKLHTESTVPSVERMRLLVASSLTVSRRARGPNSHPIEDTSRRNTPRFRASLSTVAAKG